MFLVRGRERPGVPTERIHSMVSAFIDYAA
jgi:hypothetical protein